MFILITYDVDTTTKEGQRRLRKVSKECVNYGHRVQNSVYECVVTEAQYIVLCSKIENLIDKEFDNVRIYFLGKKRKITCIGKDTAMDVTGNLII